jgi:hypothetical protein
MRVVKGGVPTHAPHMAFPTFSALAGGSRLPRREPHAGVPVSVAVSSRPAATHPEPARRLRAFQRQPAVYGAMMLYTFASIGLMATRRVGLTSEHVILLGTVTFALVGKARAFVWDWLPFLFVAVMFADLTSVSSPIAGGVHAVGPIVFERSLLGGTIATMWLQAHIGSGGLVRPLNTALTGEYLVHFVAPLTMGLWLWLCHREHFGRFVGAFTILMGTGFVIYLLYPEMPPWLAARHGFLPPVHRIVVDTLQHLGGFGSLYAGADPEPNAAMPSLHVAVPMLIACTAVGLVRQRSLLAWLWMMYPLTLGFGVTYLGEHYIADTVVGLVLGAACYALMQGLERLADSTRRRVGTQARAA